MSAKVVQTDKHRTGLLMVFGKSRKVVRESLLKRIRRHRRTLLLEQLEPRLTMDQSNTLFLVFNGQQVPCDVVPTGPTAWMAQIRDSVKGVIEKAGADTTKLYGLPHRGTSDYSDHLAGWSSCGGNTEAVTRYYTEIRDMILDDRWGNVTWDILFVGHSRGGPMLHKLGNRIAEDLALMNRIDYAMGIHLDPTAASPFGDVYPSQVSELFDAEIVYDDQFAFLEDLDLPGRVEEQSRNAVEKECKKTIFGSFTCEIVGAGVGWVAGKVTQAGVTATLGAIAPILAEVNKLASVLPLEPATVDGRQIPGASYRQVRSEVREFVDSPLWYAFVPSIMSHTKIHEWYAATASDDQLPRGTSTAYLGKDVLQFLTEKDDLLSLIAINNNSGADISFRVRWADEPNFRSVTIPKSESKPFDRDRPITSLFVEYQATRGGIARTEQMTLTPTLYDGDPDNNSVKIKARRRYSFTKTENVLSLDLMPDQPDLVAQKPEEWTGLPLQFDFSSQPTVTFRVANKGGADSEPFTVHVVASRNKTISRSDTRVASSVQSPLGVNKFRNITLPLSVPPTLRSGAYYFGVVIEHASAEIESANNSNRFRVGNLVPTGPGAFQFVELPVVYTAPPPPDVNEPNESRETAAFLTLGGLAPGLHGNGIRKQTISRTFHTVADQDWYSLKLLSFAGAGSFIRVDHETGSVSGELVNSDGQILDTFTSRLALDHLSPGDYFIRLSNTGNRGIEYTLSYEMKPRGLPADSHEPNDSTDSATAMGLKQSVQGTIHEPGNVDFYRIVLSDWAAPGSEIRLSGKFQQGKLAVTLFHPDGPVRLTPVVGNNADGTHFATLDVSFLPPGEYYILVGADWVYLSPETYDNYYDINSYTLTTSVNPLGVHQDKYEPNESADASKVTVFPLTYTLAKDWFRDGIPDRRVLPTIHSVQDKDFYQVQLAGWGQPGNGITLTLEPTTPSLQIKLFDTSGMLLQTRIAAQGLAPVMVSFDDQPPGSYLIQVESQNGGVGGYSLSGNLQGLELDRTEPDNDIPLAVDLPTTATNLLKDSAGNDTPTGDFSGFTIHRRGDVDWYSFNLNTVGRLANSVGIDFIQNAPGVVGAGRLTLDILRATRDADDNLILDPNQMQLVSTGIPSNDKNSIVASVYGLPAGDYFVRVRGMNSETNRYSLRWDLLTAARFPFVITNDDFKVTGPLFPNSVPDSNPLVDSGVIAWTRHENGNVRVVVLDSTQPDARPVETLPEAEGPRGGFNFHNDGSLVVWSRFDGNDYEIYQFDVKTGLATQLTNNDVDDINPRISGQRVVWVRDPGSFQSEIMLFDPAVEDPSQQERRLTNNGFEDRDPQIDGDIVVWEGNLGNTITIPGRQTEYEIFFQNLARNGQPLLLTNNSGQDKLSREVFFDRSSGARPLKSVDQGRVVWVEHAPDDSNVTHQRTIWVSNGDTSTPIFTSFEDFFAPLIFGSSIVWQGLGSSPAFDGTTWYLEEEGEPYNIFLFDGNVVRQLTSPELGFGFQKPYVDNQGRVIFEGVPADDLNNGFELFVFENGTTRQLTNDEFNQVSTHINDGFVVWSQSEGLESEEIFLQKLAPQTLFFDGQFDKQTQKTHLILTENEGGVTFPQTIRRNNADSHNDLVVTLRIDKLDPNFSDRISVPATVIIPRGSSEVSFNVAVADDAILQSDEVVRVFATADGFDFAELEITLKDREILRASLDTPAEVKENAGNDSVQLRIERLVTNLDQPLVVSLSSSDPASINLPSQQVTIRAGESFAIVPMTPVAVDLLRTERIVTFTATAAGFTHSTTSVTVVDHKSLTVTASASNPNGSAEGELSGEGELTGPTVVNEGDDIVLRVSRTAAQAAGSVMLNLSSDQGDERFLVPQSVEIPAGELEAVIRIPTTDNPRVDGDSSVTFSVFASGFAPSSVEVIVKDNDVASVIGATPVPPLLFSEIVSGTSIALRLTSEPRADVLVNLAQTNPTLRFLPAEFSFSPANWNQPVSVMIALNDAEMSDMPTNIGVALESDDLDFQGLTRTIPLTYAPEVTRNRGASIASGQSVTIGTELLDVRDDDTNDSQLLFSVIEIPSRGNLEVDGVQVPVNGTFTKSDILAGKLVYRHDGGTVLSDSFSFSVTDGKNILPPVSFDINRLQVAAALPNASGFVMKMSRSVDVSALNLFDAPTTFGPADMTVVGATTGRVNGSLAVDPSSGSLRFIKTGSLLMPSADGLPILQPDTYTVTLRNGTDSIKAATGEQLEGNGDGATGNGYQFTFQVAPQTEDAIIVSIPDVVRGPGQEVHLPASDPNAGIPLMISSGIGVGSVSLQFQYNPALLEVSGFRVNPILADRAEISFSVAPGSVLLRITAGEEFSDAGETLNLGWFDASIPTNAKYGDKHLLDIRDLQVQDIFGKSISTADDDGIHVVTYLADADGSGIHTAGDAFLIVQASLNANSFVAHRLADPIIVNDADASGVLTAGDAFIVVREALGQPQNFLPNNPGVTIPVSPSDIDPQFIIANDIPALAGGTVDVPVTLNVEPAATNVGGIDFDLFFDQSKLSIVLPGGVTSGIDTNTSAGWAIRPQLVSPGHLRVAMFNFLGNPIAVGLREVAKLSFQVVASAATGVAFLNIEPVDRNALGLIWTATDGSLAITNASNVTALAVEATSADKAEGNTGTTPFTFTVTRSGDLSGATTVSYAVTGSGANPAEAGDFQDGVLPSGTLTFEPNQTTQTITIPVRGDIGHEFDEGFTVTLSGATGGATITTATANGLIRNDDAAVVPPTLSIAATDANKNEGNTGTTPFTFTVTRSGDLSGTTTVSYAVTGSGANPAEAGDFQGGVLPSGTLTFEPNQATQTITIPVRGDIGHEFDEGFTVTLSGATGGATITTATASGLIRNDDAAVVPPTLSIAATDANKNEGNTGTTPFTFTVTRSGDLSGTTTVSYAVTGSGANPAEAGDFQGGVLPSGTLTFEPNQATQTITIPVRGDIGHEFDEGFTVTLSGATGGATISTPTALGLIRNDDALPSLRIEATSADKAEGNTGTTPFTFTVTRTGDLSGATTVSYAVTGSGANPADAGDFQGGVLPSGTLTFEPNQATQTITILVRGDIGHEFDEGFTVTLSGATGSATITTATANGLIRNDDAAVVAPALSIAATDANKNEENTGTTPFTFTVTRTGDLSGTTTVSYAVTGSGANPADAGDFQGGVLPSGTLTFEPNQATQTITIPVRGDIGHELDEGFTVTLSGATGGATITTATANGLIRNDDAAVVAPALSIAASDANKNEGKTGTTPFTFTVTRSGDLSGTTTVSYAVIGSGTNPAFATDFVGGAFPAGQVAFAPGESTKLITINVAGDTIVEPDRGFTVTLSNATGGATITAATASGVIRDDDRAQIQTRVLTPWNVAAPHVVLGDSLPTAIIFEALETTTIMVHAIGVSSLTESIRVLNQNLEPIGTFENGVTRAIVQAGTLNAIIFEPQIQNRIYSVRSSAGPAALGGTRGTNVFQATDTNGDGDTTALDALVVLNALRSRNRTEGEAGLQVNHLLDVNQDGSVEPIDALLVLNHLSRLYRTRVAEALPVPLFEDESEWELKSITSEGQFVPRSLSSPSAGAKAASFELREDKSSYVIDSIMEAEEEWLAVEGIEESALKNNTFENL